jgi:hypothetical protein
VKYSAMTGQSLYYLGESNLKHWSGLLTFASKFFDLLLRGG